MRLPTVDLPEPLAPTIATRWPGSTMRLKFLSRGALDGLYPNVMSRSSTLPDSLGRLPAKMRAEPAVNKSTVLTIVITDGSTLTAVVSLPTACSAFVAWA